MITGGKVNLFTREQADLMREAIWNSDEELNTLDPMVGKIVNYLTFAIKTLDGKHIGVCGVYNFDARDGQIGIRIGDKNYWGKGYGTDAISALVNYCLTTLGIARIWLKVLPTNARAIRCYEKSGFTKCGKVVYDGIEFVTMEIRR
ncbi:unnamed protein product [marine sediment metagenome]|uniref:N-acetyltransferase domain-containing protein n=1 Tax=marine sediment metagenome TaxID=412755 RepID=X1FQX1_9ZZZZ